MAILKHVSILIFFFTAFGADAFSQELCFSKNKIYFPPELLNHYFSSPLVDRVLPLGNLKCELPAKNLKIYNAETDEFVADFKVSDVVKTPFNNFNPKKNNTNPVVLKNLLLGKNLDPIKFVFYLYQHLKISEPIDFSSDMHFAIGKVLNLQKDKAQFFSYRLPKKHWAGESIEYDRLIQFFNDPNTNYIHVDGVESNNIPIINNKLSLVNPLKIFKAPLEIVVSSLNLKRNQNKSPVVVISNTPVNMQGYNTMTNAFYSGFENIYWFKDSTSSWRNRLSSIKENYYLPGYSTITNNQLFKILEKNSSVEILDLSDEAFYKQVHFKNAVRAYPIFYNPEQLKAAVSKLIDGPAFQKFLTTFYASYGRHLITDSKKLLKSRSNIVIVSNDHYSNSSKVKSVYDQLVAEGHPVQILESNTGDFLSFLNSIDSPLKNEIVENKTFQSNFTKSSR